MSDYTVTYAYDELNRIVRENDSNGSITEYVYNAQGLLISKTVKLSTPEPTVVIRINGSLLPLSPADIERIVADMLQRAFADRRAS